VAENFLAVKDKVQRVLTDFVGSLDLDKDGHMSFAYESTRVVITVIDQEERTLVKIAAPIAFNVPASPQLFKWLALNTGEKYFGSFEVSEYEDGSIFVGAYYTLLGDSLDPDELKNAVTAIAFLADEEDDKVKDQFGGTRLADL
jgi:hypothetical protein